MYVVNLHLGSKYSCVSPLTTSILSVKQVSEHALLLYHLPLRLQNYLFTFLFKYLLSPCTTGPVQITVRDPNTLAMNSTNGEAPHFTVFIIVPIVSHPVFNIFFYIKKHFM